MRKALIFIMMVLFSSSLMAQTKEEERELSREEQKVLQQKIDSMEHSVAVKAIQDTAFTLEADHVVFKYGQRAYVSSSTNFVAVKNGEATVQVAFNIPVAGPNGMGGVTVEGTISGYKMKTDKKGNTFVTFNVMGTGISAQLSITLITGSNQARVDILPNFSSNRLTLVGTILAPEQSFVVRGRSL